MDKHMPGSGETGREYAKRIKDRDDAQDQRWTSGEQTPTGEAHPDLLEQYTRLKRSHAALLEALEVVTASLGTILEMNGELGPMARTVCRDDVAKARAAIASVRAARGGDDG